MTLVVQQLGEAVAIQYNGLTDKSVPNNGISTLGKPLFVGLFKRGVVGKVLTIHASNLNSALGYDPNNPFYIAVRSFLDANRGSTVQVINLGRKKATAFAQQDGDSYHIFLGQEKVTTLSLDQVKQGFDHEKFNVSWNELTQKVVITMK